MSTKIYNAYKFIGCMDELMEILVDFRKTWNEFQYKRMLYLIRRSYNIFKEKGEDIFDLWGCPSDSRFIAIDDNIGFNWHGFSESVIRETEKEFTSHDNYWDIKGSAVVIPYNNQIYIQKFIAVELVPVESGFAPDFTRNDERFLDFHYQDQSDHWYDLEEGMSQSEKAKHAQEYQERKRIWHDLMDKRGFTPKQLGLVYDFHDTSFVFTFTGNLKRCLLNNEDNILETFN